MSEQKLTIDQALANIQEVVANYRGTLGEHLALQKSMKMIQDAAAWVKSQLNEKVEIKEKKEITDAG